MFGGFAGSFFAARQGFVSPESFVFLESAIILAIVVLGGMGSLVGIAVAAIVMIGGTELLREMDVPQADLRAGLHAGTLPHADLRPGDGRRHGLEATRLCRHPRTDGLPARNARVYPAASPRKVTADDDRSEHDDKRSHSQSRTPVDALRRPDGHQRSLVRSLSRRYHGADRPERRRQDDRLQLHHRLLQADDGHDHHAPEGRQGIPAGAHVGFRRSRAMPRSPVPSRTSACSRA